MNQRITIAFLGGLTGVVGTPLIIFSQNLLMNMIAFNAGIPAFPFPWDLWLSKPLSSILRWDSFMAGFIAVFFVAPSAIQRIDSASLSGLRFPRTGTLYGALAGFICCVLVASLRLSTDFVEPTLYRDGFDALPHVLRYYTTYVPIAAVATGPFAAILGGCVGTLVELRRRKALRERPVTVTKTDQ